MSLARQLSPDQPLYLIAPCGLDGGPIPPTYGEMADLHVRALREVLPEGPYRLGGTCNGGLVAYEMARRLEAAGQSVELLVLFGASAANLRFRRLSRWTEILGGLLRQSSEERSRAVRAPARRDPSPRSDAAVEAGDLPVRRAGKIPRTFGGCSGARTHRETRADGALRRSRSATLYLRIDREYFPGPYAGRVTLLWPSEGPETPEEEADAWRKVAGEVDLHVIPGSHTMGLSRNVRLLAEELSRCLEAPDNGALAAR